MKIVFSGQFLKSTKVLTLKLQAKLDKLIDLLAQNTYHPILHTKELTGDMTGFWSFRITQEWRVLFQFLSVNIIQILRVKHRKDIYR